MNDFTILLAGIPIGISPLCPKIRDFFRGYFSLDKPCLRIAATEQDLQFEQTELVKRYKEEPEFMAWPRVYLETLAVFRLIANRVPEYDTVLFHGSVIAVNGKAYLFAAPSGTGKTTHTMLWLKQLPDAHVLNGDKPFLKVQPDGHVLACGGPWRGKEALGRNESLPLEAVCLLERSRENHIHRIMPREAISTMIQRTHIPADPVNRLKAVQLLDRISNNVRLYRLGCNMEPEAAHVSYSAMVEDDSEETRDGKNDL